MSIEQKVFLGIGVAVGLIILYVLSRPILPPTARLDGGYLLWFIRELWRSARLAGTRLWIWLPAAICFLVNAGQWVLSLYPDGFKDIEAARWMPGPVNFWEELSAAVGRLDSYAIHGLGLLAAFIAYFIFQHRVRRLMQDRPHLFPADARFASIVLSVSTVMAILVFTSVLWLVWTREAEKQQEWLKLFPYLTILTIPIYAWVVVIYLSIVHTAVRDAPADFGVLVPKAFRLLWMMTLWTVFVLLKDWLPSTLYAASAGFGNRQAADVLQLILVHIEPFIFFVPIILVSEECGLGEALRRQFLFIRDYFWRYLLLVAVAALLLALPHWLGTWAQTRMDLTTARFLQTNFFIDMMNFLVLMALLVFYFRFYQQEAGTRERQWEGKTE